MNLMLSIIFHGGANELANPKYEEIPLWMKMNSSVSYEWLWLIKIIIKDKCPVVFAIRWLSP